MTREHPHYQSPRHHHRRPCARAQVMSFLMGLKTGTEFEDDDPTLQYMLQAWARICKSLGQEFLPYMPTVMPPLLANAMQDAGVVVEDDDGEDEDEDDDVLQVIADC